MNPNKKNHYPKNKTHTPPIYGDPKQHTTDIRFFINNLPAYSPDAKVFVAVNGRALLPVTGHIISLDNNIVVINTGTSNCCSCKTENSKTLSESIEGIIYETALSIADDPSFSNDMAGLFNGIIAGMHKAMHAIGIADKQEAQKFIESIAEKLKKEVANCWKNEKTITLNH